MATIKTWKQKNGIEIDEVEFDGDWVPFELRVDGRHVVTIYVDSPEQAEDMRARLDAGEDVRDWEDGNGNFVGTLIGQRTTGLRDTLRELEGAGACYNGEIPDDGRGTYWVNEVNGITWVDEVNSITYEYETEDPDLLVDDLTDDDLLEVTIRGL